MSLADEAIALASRPGPLCKLARLRETHPEAAADMDDAIARLRRNEPRLEATRIASLWNARAPEIRGYVEVTKDFLYRHRNDECASCRSQTTP